VVVEKSDILMLFHPLDERPLYLTAGKIVCVHDPVTGVSSLPSQGQGSIRLTVKPAAPGDQLLDHPRALFDNHPNHIFMTDAVAGSQSIGYMTFRGIIIPQDAGDAPLSVIGGRLAIAFFGDDGHPS